MPRYKEANYDQIKLIPVDFRAQIPFGSFEHTLSTVIDTHIDFGPFDAHYNNDQTGATAYDPAILLKITLYAYSRGIISSRAIERACRENITFMALSADTRPHFTTIADFISRSAEEIIHVFRDVLWVADEQGLIGRQMFAIDGCKLPSNAGKEWSGTHAEFEAKIIKLETAIERMLDKHKAEDALPQSDSQIEREQQQIDTLRRQILKLRTFLDTSDDKIGASGKPIKSNITDNDSAKMKTSKGVIQGYIGTATVDDKNQIVIAAEAHGKAQEHSLLEPLMAETAENLKQIGDQGELPLKDIQLTGDSGYHSEANLQHLHTLGMDVYLADNRFRKRDQRFINADKYKPAKIPNKQFKPSDFIHIAASHICICPANKKLYLTQRNNITEGKRSIRYRAPKSACENCHLRAQCLRDPEQTSTRSVAFYQGTEEGAPESLTDKMKRKIDSDEGRRIYSKRLGCVEPVFGHIQNMGMRRFHHRGQTKVNGQWLLYMTVHNLKKVHVAVAM
jgi:transposase